MGVLLTLKCSEGRKKNDWFTDSTNEIGSRGGCHEIWTCGGNTSDRYVTDTSWELAGWMARRLAPKAGWKQLDCERTGVCSDGSGNEFGEMEVGGGEL